MMVQEIKETFQYCQENFRPDGIKYESYSYSFIWTSTETVGGPSSKPIFEINTEKRFVFKWAEKVAVSNK